MSSHTFVLHTAHHNNEVDESLCEDCQSGTGALGGGDASGRPRSRGEVAKAQLVEQVAEKSGLTKKQALQAVASAMDTIAEAIRQGQSVGLLGVGTLSVKATAARTSVKPGTSERLQIPASRKVSFKVATPLQQALTALAKLSR